MIYVELRPSGRPNKKWVVSFSTNLDDIVNDRIVHFGDKNARDFLLLNDPESEYYDPVNAPDVREAYLARHEANENWNVSGVDTAGFWSRWLLWEKPTLEKAVQNLYKKFGIRVLYDK